MKIRIWDAYASNNSGSYTIVGAFDTVKDAQEVASLLAPLLNEQTAWFKGEQPRPSPLERFAQSQGLRWESEGDLWPEYGGKDSPEVVAVDRYVMVHHDYTVSLPSLFGHLFYAKGGRVLTELDHAHKPVVAVFEIYWPWDDATRAKLPQLGPALQKDLLSLGDSLRKEILPICHARQEHGSQGLVFAAVFDDLVRGFSETARRIGAHGATYTLKLVEAFSDSDPLGFLRGTDKG